MLLSQGQRLEGRIISIAVAKNLPHVGQSPVPSRLTLRPVEHVVLQIVETCLRRPGS